MTAEHIEGVPAADAQPVMTLVANGDYWSELHLAWRDLINSFRDARIWSALAMNDIRSRYRGSLLGPLWITLTTSAFVGGIGLLYAGIMRVPLSEYLPFLASGIVIWNLISGTLIESGDTFSNAAGILKQTAISPIVFVWRTMLRVLINFAHEVIVILAVLGIFGYIAKTHYLALPLGFALLVLNLSWMAFLISIASARFRDVPQVIRALVQFVFFLSPVIWPPGSGRAAVVVAFNPIYYLLDVTRTPLLGQSPHPTSYVVLTVMALLGGIVAFLVYARVRRRIVHYI